MFHRVDFHIDPGSWHDWQEPQGWPTAHGWQFFCDWPLLSHWQGIWIRVHMLYQLHLARSSTTHLVDETRSFYWHLGMLTGFCPCVRAVWFGLCIEAVKQPWTIATPKRCTMDSAPFNVRWMLSPRWPSLMSPFWRWSRPCRIAKDTSISDVMDWMAALSLHKASAACKGFSHRGVLQTVTFTATVWKVTIRGLYLAIEAICGSGMAQMFPVRSVISCFGTIKTYHPYTYELVLVDIPQ